MRWLNDITNSTDMNLSKLQKMEKDGKAWHAAVHAGRVRDDLATDQQVTANVTKLCLTSLKSVPKL